jgi:WD40 repeat protein
MLPSRLESLFNRFASISLRWFVGFTLLSFVAAISNGDEKSATYAATINEAQSLLESGAVAEATAKLMTTEESRRGFEFRYLQARAAQSSEGQSAPDLVRTVAKPAVETRYALLNPVAAQIVFICRDGGLRIHDLNMLEAEAAVVKHPAESPVWTGIFSHDGKTFASGHQNGEVIVWDVTTWMVRQTVKVGEDWPVRELAISPDGLAMVAESKSGLELWSLVDNSAKKIAKVGDRYNFGEGLAFSPTGDLIATGGMLDILLHDAKTGQQTKSMRHASYTMGLKFSPDGKQIASAPRGNVNKFLAVFDVTQDEPKFNVGPFGHYVAGLAFSPDGQRIAATGCEKVLRLFDAATGETVLSIKREDCGSAPAFSHDGQLMGWSEPSGFMYIDLGKRPE